MMVRRWICAGMLLAVALHHAHAQAPGRRRPRGAPPGRERENLVERYDADGNGRLNDDERAAARAHARKNVSEAPRFPVGGDPDAGEDQPTPQRLSTAEQDMRESARVAVGEDTPLYDTEVVRTLFLRFPADDWYDELRDLYHTEVDVPATLIVDGREYPSVGVRFRGNSSYFMTRESLKKSWNISLDWEHKGQRLYGYRTLNLLNSHEDPSFVREVIYSEIGRDYTPAPKANHVRLVVNGDDWGVYVNVQQFNKDYTRDTFGQAAGDRWKVPANPKAGDGGLAYLGPDITEYQEAYRLGSKASDGAWHALVELCDVLGSTPDDDLEAALDPLFNIDGALWHVAMENVFVDHDGYMSRASDYNLYRDPAGRFHLVPHDSNETFRYSGRGGGPSSLGDSEQVDPFLHADSDERPVIRRLLAIPHLRARYAAHVRAIVDEWLDWERIGDRVEAYQTLIGPHVEADGKQLYSYEAFLASATEEFTLAMPGGFGPPPGMAGPGGSGPPSGLPPAGPGDVADADAARPRSDGEAPDRRSGPRGGRGRGRGGRGGYGPPSTPGLQPWVTERRAYLLGVEEIARARPVVEDVTRVLAGVAGQPTSIRVTSGGDVGVSAAILYHSRGRYAPFTRVTMAPGGGEWTADIPAYAGGSSVYYYVEFRGENGATAFAPPRAEASALSFQVEMTAPTGRTVVINEFMARNEAAVADPQGEFDDWIELHNTTDVPVDLTGHYLSDDPTTPHKWRVPDGVVIAPDGYLTVWADEDGGASPGLHASFKLAGGGESILLVASEEQGGAALDSVAYGEQTVDVSFGRMPNGVGEFGPMAASPGRANAGE